MARKLGRNRSRCVSKISRLKDPRVQPGKGPRPTAAADSYAIFPSYARPVSTEYLHSNLLAVCQPRHLHVLDVDLTMSSVNFAVDMLLGALDFQVRNMTDSSGCQGACLQRNSQNSSLRSEEHTSELQSRPHLVC